VRSGLLFKFMTVPLIVSLAFGTAFANPTMKSTTITFERSPGTSVVIDTDGKHVTFTACRGSDCAPVGRPEGYTSTELTDRYKQLRFNVWSNRLIVSAGTVCGALLGGTLGFAEGASMFDAVINSLHGGPIEAAIGAIIAPMLAVVSAVAAYALMFTYATLGMMLSLPGTWFLMKLVRPDFVLASEQIRDGIRFEQYEVTTDQDFEEYLASLEFALGMKTQP
jgi:hypothetical protein